jgi:aspartyl protease family protein
VLDGGVRIDRQRVVALPGLGPNPLLGMDVLGKLHWTQQGGLLRFDLRAAEPPSQ